MKLAPQDLVIWSDEHLLAVNKPSGLLTLPHGFDPDQPHLRELLEPEFGPLWIVHRLDRDTSGLLVLARNEWAHRSLNTQFADRQVMKVYHALTHGTPDWNEHTVKLSLRKNADRQHRTLVDPRGGKPAITRLRLLGRFRVYSLIQAEPRTGRTHQIRSHLAAIDLPLVGDSLYGDGQGLFLSQVKLNYRPGRTGERPLISRLGLHAHSLAFQHPHTGEAMRLEAPYPKDFRAAVTQLRKAAPQ